jgi:hypothetical protein
MSKIRPAVRFLHYGETRNIGDFYCSPRHYFDFDSERETLIVGGGASNNFFCGRARKQRAQMRIAWGIGQSWSLDSKPSRVDRLIKSVKRKLTYARASTRDISLASKHLPLVPCVSVFHPVTEIPVGNELGIFLNSDTQVSGLQADFKRASTSTVHARALFANNGLAADEFMTLFGRTGSIITNSYHAAYWGLLSGRNVHILGYSSKFTNLAALFDFPESSVVRIRRGDSASLHRAIAACEEREPLRLKAPGAVRANFRARNLDFARSLADVGVKAQLKRPYADNDK